MLPITTSISNRETIRLMSPVAARKAGGVTPDDTSVPSVFAALMERHAVRAFKPTMLPRETIESLLNWAVRAPSAMNLQPWSFVVVTDQPLLQAISSRSKELWLAEHGEAALSPEYLRLLRDPDYNIFYHAPALIIICATSDDPQAGHDCYLAGENLMLAAVGMGLGTCPIGFAWPALRSEEFRARLGIPHPMMPVLPVAVGYPADSELQRHWDRRPPRILTWL